MASFKFGALIERVTSTATAGATTTLLNNSSTYQRFTGVLTQTVVLPDATTMVTSMRFVIQNRSTGVVTVNDGSAALLTTVAANSEKTIQLYSIGTVAGTWDVSTAQASVGAGFGSGGTTAINPATQNPFNITTANNGTVFEVNTANGVEQMNLPAPTANLIFSIADTAGSADLFNITLHRSSTEKIGGVAADFVMQSPFGIWTFIGDGTNWLLLS